MSKQGKRTGFHSPFAAASERLAGLVKPAPPPTPAARNAPPAPAPPPAPVVRSDEELLADHLAGVVPLAAQERSRTLLPPAPGARRVSRRAADEAEAYAQLADLVDGAGPFSISDTDEYLEFLAPGIDRRLLRRLRAGDYALQGHLDLHGMTRDQARAAVEAFLTRARVEQRRCVLLVHGRGLNSKDQIPVLKANVKAWLERGPMGRLVLAFATARPCDGGAGALYVLLRR